MTEQEARHLDLLATFHYVAGGITALFFCFPLIHVAIGLMMIVGGFASDASSGEQVPIAFMGWMFFLMGLAFVLMGWTLAFLMIRAGRRLKARKSWTFCLVIAGLECMLMPYRTVLGVFTLIVLNKERVKAAFEAAQS